jgi:isopentenyldiphosphate isomerase
MAEQMWHCSNCGHPYFYEEQAEECEKSHVHLSKFPGVETFKDSEKFPDEIVYKVISKAEDEEEAEACPNPDYPMLVYEIRYQKVSQSTNPA